MRSSALMVVRKVLTFFIESIISTMSFIALFCPSGTGCCCAFPHKKETKKNISTCVLNEIIPKFNPKFLIEYYIR